MGFQTSLGVQRAIGPLFSSGNGGVEGCVSVIGGWELVFSVNLH